MRYFTMEQDLTLPYAMEFRDFNIKKGSHVFYKEDKERLNEMVILYLSGNGDEAMYDFIQHPVYMLAEKYKELIEAHEDSIEFQEVVMIHKEAELQHNYVQILPDKIDAKSELSEHYPDGSEKRLVLSLEKIKDHHLFMLKDSRFRHPIVSLALVEGFLRRGVSGILFKEVEVV